MAVWPQVTREQGHRNHVGGVINPLDDDTGPQRPLKYDHILRSVTTLLIVAAMLGGLLLTTSGHSVARAELSSPGGLTDAVYEKTGVFDIFTPSILTGLLCLILLSAFFSASEVAFFSIHRLRLRGMEENGGVTGRMVAELMNHPGRLLTTILVGNMFVNVTISALLPGRLEQVLEHSLGLSAVPAYLATVLLSTAILVYFGEVTPKIFAVSLSERFARVAVIPLKAVDWVLAPICWLLLRLTDFIFRITRFNDIKAAPFITDDEFKSLLSHSEVDGVIEEEEGQMIQGILDLSDAMLREILVPRPDVIALNESDTVGEALALYREHEFSRMPVYAENLDHITGMLYAKDMLSCVIEDKLDMAVKNLAHPPHFVPVTMTVHTFVKDSQRTKMHMAIVVDEYGGTEGIVTLEDAIEEVVGDIQDAPDEDEPLYKRLEERKLRVDGTLPLDELSDLIGILVEDEEHETVAGFLMAQTSKILEKGDRVHHNGVDFVVEKMDGKRVASLVVEVLKVPVQGDAR